MQEKINTISRVSFHIFGSTHGLIGCLHTSGGGAGARVNLGSPGHPLWSMPDRFGHQSSRTCIIWLGLATRHTLHYIIHGASQSEQEKGQSGVSWTPTMIHARSIRPLDILTYITLYILTVFVFFCLLFLFEPWKPESPTSRNHEKYSHCTFLYWCGSCDRRKHAETSHFRP